jgi:hypothetical protein
VNTTIYKVFAEEVAFIKEAIGGAQLTKLQQLFKAKPKVKPWLQQVQRQGGFKFQHPSVAKFQQVARAQA